MGPYVQVTPVRACDDGLGKAKVQGMLQGPSPGGARLGTLVPPPYRGTGVPHLQENAIPWDPTVGLGLGS